MTHQAYIGIGPHGECTKKTGSLRNSDQFRASVAPLQAVPLFTGTHKGLHFPFSIIPTQQHGRTYRELILRAEKTNSCPNQVSYVEVWSDWVPIQHGGGDMTILSELTSSVPSSLEISFIQLISTWESVWGCILTSGVKLTCGTLDGWSDREVKTVKSLHLARTGRCNLAYSCKN
jgi:hypothetical protein